MDFITTSQIIDEVLVLDALPSTAARRDQEMHIIHPPAMPNPLMHFYSNGTEAFVAEGEEESQWFWDTIRALNRRHGPGLTKETVSEYLAMTAGCSESEEICTVCQDEIWLNGEIAKLRCGHVFHLGCIEVWLMVKNECPVCRASVVPLSGRP
ncbi:hypothetical protein HPP92_025764 [Vanilla planifolia]|uniref:RING-type E3 ubiquitin transferase n=1 Tax=Vanilla planifolia TaxID=51239 RepID=A0A835U9N3_VANPL|nr:hypothetical protein HPP92_025764 [Vanilla planifolia]